jgi:hypothetical protein
MLLVAKYGLKDQTEGFPDESYAFRYEIITVSCAVRENKNAQIYENEFPKAAAAIQENHYVDVYLGGARDVEEAGRPKCFHLIQFHI